jgi:redox-sensitive bicupin YhaK (pirin superfamily)
MIYIRKPFDIYQAKGKIQNGTFSGRWHFSFGEYRDPEYTYFGTLRVFNDDTFSPSASLPLHPHREIEIVTYCVEGEFRHEDAQGKGGILKKGCVRHTTVGKGMSHTEINNLQDKPIRFVQMWFFPSEPGHEPSADQKCVEQSERTNRFLPLVSNDHPEALSIHSDAKVYSCFLQEGHIITYEIKQGKGVYIYVLEGGPILVNSQQVMTLGAAKILDETDLDIKAENDTELLLVEVLLI